MLLTLDTLKETGAFTGRPVEKEIKWKGRDGQEHIATRQQVASVIGVGMKTIYKYFPAG